MQRGRGLGCTAQHQAAQVASWCRVGGKMEQHACQHGQKQEQGVHNSAATEYRGL